MAEVLVNLDHRRHPARRRRGASCSASSTTSITDADDWVETLDQFGLLSERAVLLDQLTAEQNLAMPLSLELDELPGDVRAHVRTPRDEVGLTTTILHSRWRRSPPPRACASGSAARWRSIPACCWRNIPTPRCRRDEVAAFAADLSRVVAGARHRLARA